MTKEELRKHCEWTCNRWREAHFKGLNTAYEEHKLILDLLNQTEWIPVSERLPEAVEEVIVTRKFCNLLPEEDTIDTTVAEYWGECNGKPYFKQHGAQLTGKVLAWMPLPEPWKGDEE